MVIVDVDVSNRIIFLFIKCLKCKKAGDQVIIKQVYFVQNKLCWNMSYLEID